MFEVLNVFIYYIRKCKICLKKLKKQIKEASTHGPDISDTLTYIVF